jgi:hypothetical protein
MFNVATPVTLKSSDQHDSSVKPNSTWREWVVGDSYKLRNTSPAYYRDKFLILAIPFFVLLGISQLQNAGSVLKSRVALSGWAWIGSALVCLLLTNRKLLVLSSAGLFLGIRASIAFAQTGKIPFLIAGLLLAGSAFWMVKRADRSQWPVVQPYSVPELVIDLTIFFCFLFLLIKFT